MKFEVLEQRGEWIVRRNGAELARFPQQPAALEDVSARLLALKGLVKRASLGMRYELAIAAE
jgi:hypothetical protein